jgi:hypothetical protein
MPEADEYAEKSAVYRNYKNIYEEMLKIYRELGLDPDKHIKIEPKYKQDGLDIDMATLDGAYPQLKLLTPSQFKQAAKMSRTGKLDEFIGEKMPTKISSPGELTKNDGKILIEELGEENANLVKKGIRAPQFFMGNDDLPRVNSYVFDLDPIRKALAEGKRIPAFKDGGFVSIDDMLAEL